MEQIRENIELGTYVVDSERVAAAILARLFWRTDPAGGDEPVSGWRN